MPKHPINGNWYLTFTKDHDKQLAKDQFEQAFNRKPRVAKIENWLLWVGPISDSERVFWYNKEK